MISFVRVDDRIIHGRSSHAGPRNILVTVLSQTTRLLPHLF